MNDNKKRFALLIDVENVPAIQMSKIMDKTKGYGRVTIKRAYTDWTQPNNSFWKKSLIAV